MDMELLFMFLRKRASLSIVSLIFWTSHDSDQTTTSQLPLLYNRNLLNSAIVPVAKPKAARMSSPRAASPVNSPAGASTGRPSSPTPPGGPKTAIRRRAAADQKDKVANARPSSTRAAGAGGSSSTMLRLYTDESPGLKVDPVVVLVLSLVFIFSVVALHIIAKVTRKFSS
ncbi:Protein transport protein subunit beta [Lachnellula occidentalis]|uniref:Protein transport protein subunit beta n=1 Tax=Lachnellula occidentalis TaxID=215460 RepID=A0A8H8S4L8_9HELO|nr:Protein transport protein subunit beta [Lachnellula occidentalis]